MPVTFVSHGQWLACHTTTVITIKYAKCNKIIRSNVQHCNKNKFYWLGLYKMHVSLETVACKTCLACETVCHFKVSVLVKQPRLILLKWSWTSWCNHTVTCTILGIPNSIICKKYACNPVTCLSINLDIRNAILHGQNWCLCALIKLHCVSETPYAGHSHRCRAYFFFANSVCNR